jgi:hypothetical protein
VEKVRETFPSGQDSEVVKILQTKCGNDLASWKEKPLTDWCAFVLLLTLSQASMEKLRAAVKLAKADWRDLPVAAGFADSVDVHKALEPRLALAPGPQSLSEDRQVDERNRD